MGRKLIRKSILMMASLQFKIIGLLALAGFAASQSGDLEGRLLALESCSQCCAPGSVQSKPSKDQLLVLGGMSMSNDVEIYDIGSNNWTLVQNLPRSPMGMPAGGTGFSAGALQGVCSSSGKSSMVYLCDGGMSGDAVCRRYDVELDTWYGDVAASKKSLSNSAMVTLGDGFLYKIAGTGGMSMEEMDATFIERYDPVKNYWKVMTRLPKVYDKNQEREVGQYGAAATVVGGKIYFLAVEQYMGTMYGFFEYDPVTNKVIKKADLEMDLKSRSGMPYRPILEGVSMKDSQAGSGSGERQNFVYALAPCADRLARFNVESNLWNNIQVMPPNTGEDQLCKFSGALSVVRSASGDQKADEDQFALYIAGGMSEKSGPTNKVFRLRLDTAAAQWKPLSPLTVTRYDTFRMVSIKKFIEN